MPVIAFRVLATPDQEEVIVDDVRRLVAALGDDLDADVEVRRDLPADPELTAVWEERFAADVEGEPSVTGIELTVRRYDLGSVSGLTMHVAELLTVRGDQPAEPVLRHVQDDPGAPRVPWHVEVRRG